MQMPRTLNIGESWSRSGACEFQSRRSGGLEGGIQLAGFSHESQRFRQAAQRLGAQAHIETCSSGAAEDAFRCLEHCQRFFKASEFGQDYAALKSNCVFTRMDWIKIRPDLHHRGPKVVVLRRRALDLP